MYRLDIKVVLLLIFLLDGCASKSEKNFWNDISNNSSRYEELRQTEKIIIGNKESEQIILLTYLHNKSDKDGEYFIISVYKGRDNTQNPIKRVTEEGHNPIYIRQISRSSLPSGLKEIIPIWFDNYIIKFPYTKLKKFRVIITPIEGEEISIYFYKDMRYMIDKKDYLK